MSQAAILYPVFAQVFLTFIIMLWMGQQRVSCISRGEVRAVDIGMRKDVLVGRAAMVSNNYHNQFEMPVLFYVLCGFVFITSQADIILVSLAWGYVGIRYIHAFVHTMVRSMTKRFSLFVISCLLLMGMWGLFAFRVIANGLPG